MGSLTLITSKPINKRTYRERLVALIGDCLTVKSLCIDELETMEGYHDDLVVIMPEFIEKRAKCHISSTTNYILGHFTLSLNNIEQVDNIPAGSEVVILNDVEEFALEIIDELKALGFTQFQYYTYHDALRLERSFTYAITTMEQYLMPDIPVIIDLGRRQISLSTIGDIFSYFFGKNKLDDLIIYRYVAIQVKTTLALYRKTRDNVLLQSRLQSMTSEYEEGVFLFDREYNIIVANTKAQDLLGPGILPEDIKSFLPEHWDFQTRSTTFIQRDGSSLYITVKPLHGQANTYMAVMTDVLDIEQISRKYRKHQQFTALRAKYTFDDIIAQSDTMVATIKTAKKYARSDANILISGESGSGKELFAQSIHNASSRKENPFVAINCGALNDSLLESELFGYENGAFTGAVRGGKKGLLETADTGTLFLDEIGDASLAIQQKLLRAIQEKEFFRVGGTKPIYVDVRIISATNKNLLEEVEKGAFRRDLFYRLNAMSLYIPPLKNREQDIMYLFTCLLKEKLSELNIPFPEKQVTPELFRLLKSHQWPGNVREMENLTDALVNSLQYDPRCRLKDEITEYWQMLYGMSRKSPSEKQHPAFEIILEDQTSKLNKSEEEVLMVLGRLERAQKPLRNSEVLKYCRNNGIRLSQEQIKLRFNRLRALGFLIKGAGYSNIITEKGHKWLQEHTGI